MQLIEILAELGNTYPAVVSVFLLWLYLRRCTMGMEGLARFRMQTMPDDISGSTERVMTRIQQRHEQVRQMQRQNDAFLRMINNAWPTTKIEFGRLDPEKADITLGTCELCCEDGQLRRREVADQELLLCDKCRRDLRDMPGKVR